MIQRNSTLAVLRESFVAGSDENLSPIMHHLWKMEGVPSISAAVDGHMSPSI